VSADAKKEYGSTIVLMILGMLALYVPALWLLVLIPTALVIWYAIVGTTYKKKPGLTRHKN
jgi:hypothetical protein